MADTITGKALKLIGGSLGRFADIRVTAKEPMDRVVLQGYGGLLKIVTGNSNGTLIATIHDTDQSLKAVVSARELLTLIKGLKAKDEVRFADLNQGWEIGCSMIVNGKAHHLLRLSKALPKIMLPPPSEATVHGGFDVSANELSEFQIFAGAVNDDSMVDIKGTDGKIHLSAWNQNGPLVSKWASRVIKGRYGSWGQISPEFLLACRDLGDAHISFVGGLERLGKIVIENEVYRAIGEYHSLTGGFIPVKPNEAWQKVGYKTVIDRADLIKQVRIDSAFDNLTRIGVQCYGDSIKVVPFEKYNDHNWYFSGERLLELLSSIPHKQVGIGLRENRLDPMQIRIPNWHIEIAPIKFSKTN